MKKRDNNRHSLVAFLGSIKFSSGQPASGPTGECQGHFARPRYLTHRKQGNEDAQLIRSAN